MLSRRTLRKSLLGLWSALALLLIWLGLRLWVGDVYHVVSTSMEPTLIKGDRVWVQYGREELQRFDLVAFKGAAGRTVVKRLIGFPKEEILIDQFGDVWKNDPGDRSKPEHRIERPEQWVPLFDDRVLSVGDYFRHGGTALDPWREVDGVWHLDARDIPMGRNQGFLGFRGAVDSSYLLPDGTLRKGSESVGDLRVRFEVFVEESKGIFALECTEHGDRFEAWIGLKANQSGRLIFRHFQRSKAIGGGIGQAEIPTGQWVSVTYQNLDNQVKLWIGERLVVDYDYRDKVNDELLMGSIGERVKFGGFESRMRFRSIRVDRDMSWSAHGTFGVQRRLQLSPDHYYFLGDNSEASEDSRVYGPVHRSRIVGRVRFRFWPFRGWGRL